MSVGRAFLAVPLEGWPETVELLQGTGRPWPEWAAVADLRWHVDQAGEVPGRPTLRRRWSWTDHAVRTLLAEPARWWDPTKGAPPSSRAELKNRAAATRIASRPPADRQPTASRPPADRQPTDAPTPAIETESPADRQPTASRPPADRQRASTRVLDPPSPSPSPSPSPKTQTVERGRSTVTAGPVLALVDPGEPPDERRVPEWAARARRPRGVAPAALADAVGACLEAIRQRPTDPHRCATDARHILGLWRDLGHPALAELVRDVGLVAAAARECPDRLFARDIRAEGWDEGTDRSRSVATLCRRDRWGDRIEAARAWDAAGRPRHTDAQAAALGVWRDTRTDEERRRDEERAAAVPERW